MGPVVRLCLAAFLMDTALYLTLTGVPYKALALGAGALVLGFLPAAYSLSYSANALWAGRFNEGRVRLRAARVLLPLAALSVMGLAAAGQVAWLFALPAVLGLCMAFYWPQVQATLADVSPPERLAANVGWFNVSWSVGKGTGYLLGGFLLATFGFRTLFLAAAAAVVGVWLVLWTLGSARRGPGAAPAPAGEGAAPPAPGREAPSTPLPRGLLPAAWLGNFTTFGAAAALNFHYPQWLTAHGLSEAVFGTFLGLILLSETAAFVVLRRVTGWRFRGGPVLAAPLPIIAALLLLPRLESPAAILALAPVVGAGLGMAYAASIVHSLHDPRRRGRNAGMHEAALAGGAVVVPMAGGWAATVTGTLESPYLAAAALAGIGLALQTGMLVAGRARRRADPGA